MPSSMSGRGVLVTGAGSGIGRAAALRFAREGAVVACADRDGAAAEETAAQAEHALAVTADVTSEADLARAVAALHERAGSVDALYANAGIDGTGRAHELERADWDRVIAVNLTGVWLSIKAVLPLMLGQGRGAIVTQASIGGIIGVAGLPAYAAAKAGVIGLTRQVAVDYAREGIRANALCPGTVWTPLVERTYEAGAGLAPGAQLDPETTQATIARRYPLGRLGTPEEIASFAVFLASDESAWTTGQAFVVDGGMTAA
jgi:NAD(P)-dependent dehydrogenase (short-subunit alcohol dehydrogenase family)